MWDWDVSAACQTEKPWPGMNGTMVLHPITQLGHSVTQVRIYSGRQGPNTTQVPKCLTRLGWRKQLQPWQRCQFTNTRLKKVQQEDGGENGGKKCAARHKNKRQSIKCAANGEAMQSATDANQENSCKREKKPQHKPVTTTEELQPCRGHPTERHTGRQVTDVLQKATVGRHCTARECDSHLNAFHPSFNEKLSSRLLSRLVLIN